MTDKGIYDIFVAKIIDPATRDILVYDFKMDYYIFFGTYRFQVFLLSYRFKLLREKMIFDTIESIMKLFKRQKND